MKKLIEGRDYTIHDYTTKVERKSKAIPICNICANCNNKSLCKNRRNKYTMSNCEICKNCKDSQNCDKFYIYINFKAELLKLGRNVTTGKLIRKQFNGKTRDEAIKKMNDYYIDITEHGIKEKVYHPNSSTIIDIATKLEEKKLKDGVTNDNTYNRNMQTIQTCGCYKFTNIPIQNVTKKQIENFLESERTKSNSTLDKEYRVLKNVFEYAEYKKLVKENYFMGYEKIKLPKSLKEDKDVVAFTSKEEYILKEYIKTHPNQYNNIILLCLYTGMRIGEVLALTTNDITFDKGYGTIDVNKSLTKNKKGEIIMGKTTKTKNGKRKLELIKKSRNVIDIAIKEMKPNKYNALFLRPDGKFYEDSQVNGAFKRICKNAGIKVIDTKKKKSNGRIVNLKLSDVNVHMLRHTFATRCIEAGVEITVLQKLLGHSNIQTTINIYGDIYDYYRQKEIKKYDEYMQEVDEKFNEELNKVEEEYFCKSG